MVGMDELDRFEALAAARRTNLRMDTAREVPPELVERLCRVATWAPNHKRTWPWRFCALTGDARRRLGEAAAAHEEARGAAPEKVDKAKGKYLRAPLMVAVGCAFDEDAGRHAENRDAVAAATQTFLLAATAAGLATYWGTGAVTGAPEVKALCGLGPDDELIALLYVGWPIGDVPVPARPPVGLRWVE